MFTFNARVGDADEGIELIYDRRKYVFNSN